MCIACHVGSFVTNPVATANLTIRPAVAILGSRGRREFWFLCLENSNCGWLREVGAVVNIEPSVHYYSGKVYVSRARLLVQANDRTTVVIGICDPRFGFMAIVEV